MYIFKHSRDVSLSLRSHAMNHQELLSSSPHLVRCVDVGLLLHQQLRHLEVPAYSCSDEAGRTIL